VIFVDDGCEILRLLTHGGIVVGGVFGDRNFLLVHPHLHLLLEDIGVLACALGDKLGDCGAPVSRADNGHLVLSHGRVAIPVRYCHSRGGRQLTNNGRLRNACCRALKEMEVMG